MLTQCNLMRAKYLTRSIRGTAINVFGKKTIRKYPERLESISDAVSQILCPECYPRLVVSNDINGNPRVSERINFLGPSTSHSTSNVIDR